MTDRFGIHNFWYFGVEESKFNDCNVVNCLTFRVIYKKLKYSILMIILTSYGKGITLKHETVLENNLIRTNQKLFNEIIFLKVILYL